MTRQVKKTSGGRAARPARPARAAPAAHAARPPLPARRDPPLTVRQVAEAAHHLAARDPDLRALHARHGAPPLWARPRGFRTLVLTILEQQVSLASARAVYARIVAGIGAATPAAFLAAGEPRLRALGVTRQKARYCVRLATAIEERRFDLAALGRLDDEAATAALTRLDGIGPWTAHIYLLMALRRPDVWPTGDLALVATLQRIKRMRRPPSPERAAGIASAWRPWRSVAARMLWQEYLARRADGKARR